MLRRVFVWLSVFHLAFQLAWWVPEQWSRNDQNRDVTIYYAALQRLERGEAVYQPYENYGPHILPDRFFYPPPFLALLWPLRDLSFLWFSRLWYGLVLAAFWIFAACLARIATGRWSWKSVLGAGLVLQLTPGAAVAVAFGNFEPVMWACYGLSVAALVCSRQARAALPLAFAVLMKLHPLWALSLVCFKGGRRAVWGAALVLVSGIALGMGASGWENGSQWWAATSPVVSQGNFYGGNLSLSFLGVRLVDWLGWNYETGPLPPLFRGYLALMSLGAPLLTLYFSRFKPLEWRVALLAAATILFAPLCWGMYLPTLLLIPALWLRDAGVFRASEFQSSKSSSSF
mgnify:FL=1